MSTVRPLRVLVVRADGVGDTILTMPLLAALRSHPAPIEISVVASTAAAALLRFVPHIDHVLTIDSTSASLVRRLSLARTLLRESFDVAICVSEKWWPHVWTRASRAAVRVGVDPGAVQPLKRVFLPVLLTHRVRVPVDPHAASPLHEIERYLALLGPLGIDATPPPLTLPLPDAVIEGGRQRVRAAFSPDITPVAVHLSHKWGTEGWPATTVAEMCAGLLDNRADIGLVLLGGAEEAGLAPVVMDRLRDRASRVLDTGTSEFAEWAGLIRACRALVTMDTAAAHLAAALGVPVVDVFQDHRFEHFATRWAPWKVAARTIRRPAIPPSAGAEERRSYEAGFCGNVARALGELL